MRLQRIMNKNQYGGLAMLKKVLTVVACVAILATPALALDASQAAAEHKAAAGGDAKSYLGLALGFGLALAAFGGALGQSRAITAAVDAVARQPEAGGRIQGMMIIGLALIETLVIYMLLICFMWGTKV
jgi:F-type H+-transporting ATPase subunit c